MSVRFTCGLANHRRMDAAYAWMACALMLGSSFGCIADEVPDELPANSPDAPTETPSSQMIIADFGGTVSYGDQISLVIPPHSLERDTVISVEPLDSLPIGDADGFTDLGVGFRFSPPGTEFALAQPAIMRWRYDRNALSARGLAPETMQIYYFDEDRERYVNVVSSVDTEAGVITARIEHFTQFVAMAITLVPGNAPPVILPQATWPTVLRAGAPMYLRARVTDFDLGGSVAGASVCYRKLHPAPGPSECHPMAREIAIGANDMYSHLIPGSFIGAADLGLGDDIEYTIEAVDNLGEVVVSGPHTLPVNNIYVPGSLTVQAATATMTAGSERLFTAQGQDTGGMLFTLVPESADVLDGIGRVLYNEREGVAVRVEQNGVGSLQLSAGGDSADSVITVFNGSLARIAIFDQDGIERTDPDVTTMDIKEGRWHLFDALGYDQYGNQIPILPTWTSDASLGLGIDQTGELYTLGGSGFGQVVAQLGAISAQIFVHTLDRSWVAKGGSLNKDPTHSVYDSNLGMFSGTPYVAWREKEGGVWTVRVKYWNGSTWKSRNKANGGPINRDPTREARNPSIGRGCEDLHISWREKDANGIRQLYVKRWNGTDWVNVGGSLNLDITRGAVTSSLSCRADNTADNGTPYVAWRESNGVATQAYVKHWTGSSWVQDGGTLNRDPARSNSVATIRLNGAVPIVATRETDGVTGQIFANYYDGSTWQPMGDALNFDPTWNAITGPVLRMSGSTPYIAWAESDGANTHIYVKYHDGTDWQLIPQSVEDDSTATLEAVGLTVHGDTPYVSFTEIDGTDQILQVKYWNGVSWVHNGLGINHDLATADMGSRIFVQNGDTPFISWREKDAAGIWQLYVKALE